ncbi:MAG: Trk system potassium transporter TrkA [Alcaligenaceae bacterium]|nr:Trk system potassium transporter TrkA [Alcaligenaceae bacterium]
MKILIVGAGRVGSSLAQNLVNAKNDVTVVDTDRHPLADLQERFDLRTVHGDASSPAVLEAAGGHEVDLMVCCSASDAVNLLACYLGREVFNVPRRIARLRTPYYLEHGEFSSEKFGVDHVISPERSITDYLFHLVEFPEVIEIVDFANGLVSLLTIKVSAKSRFLKLQINQNHLNLPNVNGRILDVIRDDRSLSLHKTFSLERDDEVVLAVDTTEARKAIKQLHQQQHRVRNIMIAGGGNLGERLARQLADENYNVRIIEMSEQRCHELSTLLPESVIVLHGNSTDESLLLDEHVMDMHAFLALTDADEDNIMASLLAKRLGAEKVLTLVSRQSYGELIRGSAIDIAVSPIWTTISALMRDLKQGAVVRGHRLRQGRSEAVEFKALGDKKNSKVIGRSVAKISWPKNSVLAAIVRDGQAIIPDTETVIEHEDHVIVYVSALSAMEQVDKLFQVSALVL